MHSSPWTHLFGSRSNEPELIDGSDYSREEYIGSLGDLRWVNRSLGGRAALEKYFFPMLQANANAHSGSKPLRILDVGTGSGDLPIDIVKWAKENGIRVQLTILDNNQLAAGEAMKQTQDFPEISVIRADAMCLPFREGSFDFVVASLFLHHFPTPDAARLISEFQRISRYGVIINDLRRHVLAYFGIRLLTTLLTGNRLVRHDAALSVLRAFKESDVDEISRLAGVRLYSKRSFPFRLVMISQH